jgi:hypothetical protein
VNFLQLALTSDQQQKYQKEVGKKVLASGTLFHAHTGHHHTKMLMTISGIESRPAGEASPAFASTYTDLKKDCRDAFPKSDIEGGGDMPLLCKGPDGYSIYIYSAPLRRISWSSRGHARTRFDLF